MAEKLPTTPWETHLSREAWRRGLLALTTYGIEVRGMACVSEWDWDRAAQRVNRALGVCDPELDEFWARHFSPMTTAWIHHHPRLHALASDFDRFILIHRGTGGVDFSKPEWAARAKRKT
jgi:hypothetical protein